MERGNAVCVLFIRWFKFNSECTLIFANQRINPNLDKISKYLDLHRLAVTEAVFGVLLAALAIQLVLDSLAELDIIDLLTHENG